MILSLENKQNVKEYVKKQLENFFPDKYIFEGNDVDLAVDLALDRLEYCFSNIIRRDYNENGNTHFNHLHSDQYASFLWFLANSLWKISENRALCDKLVVLNKCLHGVHVTYKCPLPDIFFLNHPVGTVIGNAQYSNYLIISQNVTINTGEKMNGMPTPHIGEYVFLGAGCIIVGEETIGNNVSIGVNTLIYKQKIPDNTIVFTDIKSGIVKMKESTKNLAASIFV